MQPQSISEMDSREAAVIRIAQLERELDAAKERNHAMSQACDESHRQFLDMETKLETAQAKLARYESAGRELPEEPAEPIHHPAFERYAVELRTFAVAQKVRADENERDAGRYRHMRSKAKYEYRNGPGIYWYLPRWGRDLSVGDRLDAAIDSAIKEQT